MSGQAQDGIDVIGRFSDGRMTLYQAKRVKRFAVNDLTGAVEKYTNSSRPFQAGRLVIAVATEVRDTAVLRRFSELRKEHQPLVIELWDRLRISEILREYPRLVERFFGLPTAEAFLGTNAFREGRGDASSYRRHWRRLVAVILSLMVVPLILVSGDSAECQRFKVAVYGYVVDGRGKRIGEMQVGDLFSRDRSHADTKHGRIYGRVEGRGLAGYVLPRKLRPICGSATQ
jgi:hypothetical protein